MKKVLKLKFKTAENKTSMITVRYPKENLAADVVKAAMQKIVDAAAFEKDGVAIYAKVVGAEYYTTQTDDIFASDAKAE
ncbi:DUF2922 domain-containing protein [Lactobacillus crispatus]|uniref:DUF2922 domain-containing protein n=1 Tax=Lactobacillus crispatus TaxID=47770 RepID=UPI00123AA6A4|nr:DUF2922 domain-containing protein [Lactobacillus crispatus]KAA8792355.1 DUF2922 domain-containing protein [Lactobacillus crispatus]